MFLFFKYWSGGNKNQRWVFLPRLLYFFRLKSKNKMSENTRYKRTQEQQTLLLGELNYD